MAKSLTNDNNRPEEELAADFKARIKNTDLGPGGNVVVFDNLPAKLVTWLKRDPKRRGYRYYLGGGGYRVHTTTAAEAKAAHERYLEEQAARDEYYNHPG